MLWRPSALLKVWGALSFLRKFGPWGGSSSIPVTIMWPYMHRSITWKSIPERLWVGSECRTNSLNPKRSYHSVSGLLEFLPVAGSTVHLCSHGPFLGMLVVLTDITYELVTGEGKDFSFCSPGDVMVLCWAPAPFCLVLVVCLFRGDTLLTGGSVSRRWVSRFCVVSWSWHLWWQYVLHHMWN